MELERKPSESCLSPAAFINQAQYSNILEGRFKQLQGERAAQGARDPRQDRGGEAGLISSRRVEESRVLISPSRKTLRF